MNDSILSYQGVKFHVVPMIDVVYFCGGFTFVAFKIVLHFRVVLRLWKSVSYVCGGVYICGKIGLRLWAFTLVGRFTFVRLTALQAQRRLFCTWFKIQFGNYCVYIRKLYPLRRIYYWF